MSARLLDGRFVSARLLNAVARDAGAFESRYDSPPRVALVTVGDDPSSQVFLRTVQRVAGSEGIACETVGLPADSSEASLRHEVRLLNENTEVHGILVQMPLPPHLPPRSVGAVLRPDKDVDGVCPVNVGLLALGDVEQAFVPSTPLGGWLLLREYGIPVARAHAVVVGRSRVVGRPMAAMLLAGDATVTICHRQTPDLGSYTRQADIVVLAAGAPGLLTGEMVKPGAAVIDFGTTSANGQLVGDADFQSVAEVAGWITPVPGGTGPMTVAALLENTMRAAARQMTGRGRAKLAAGA